MPFLTFSRHFSQFVVFAQHVVPQNKSAQHVVPLARDSMHITGTAGQPYSSTPGTPVSPELLQYQIVSDSFHPDRLASDP